MTLELQKRILSSVILIPLSFFLIIKGSLFFISFLTIIFIISSYEWLKMAKNMELRVFGIFFLIFSFYSTYFLREKDLVYFFTIVIVCISTDLGGYIFGKLFKGPRLIKISPNKTYTGMMGSFLLATIFSNLFISVYEPGVIDANQLEFILIVILISGLSQAGDLIISYFKRLYKIKNTGNILPGHGGILDRIDGMIFVFPSIYLVVSILL